MKQEAYQLAQEKGLILDEDPMDGFILSRPGETRGVDRYYDVVFNSPSINEIVKFLRDY